MTLAGTGVTHENPLLEDCPVAAEGDCTTRFPDGADDTVLSHTETLWVIVAAGPLLEPGGWC